MMIMGKLTTQFVSNSATLVLFLILWTPRPLTHSEAMSCRRNPAPPRDPQTRFEPDYPLMTTAYPSDGGIVIGKLTPVEMQYLDVPRLNRSTRSLVTADEDKFAFDLMRVGAHWFPSWYVFWHHHQIMSEEWTPYDFHYPPVIHTAYPSTGGVWVLKHTADRRPWSSEDIPSRNPTWPLEPEKLRITLGLCLTMDERAFVLKDFGGDFFQNVSECTDIPASLQAGIQAGHDYAVLLQKMDDQYYVDRWLDGEI